MSDAPDSKSADLSDIQPAQRAAILVEALPYIQEFAGRIVVVKLGGNAMVDEDLAEAFAADAGGQPYNVNADSAAIAIAEALSAEKLIYLTDVAGVLTDVADPASLISRLGATRARLLIADGVVAGGMIPKVEACLAAVAGGVGSAHILDGRIPHVVLLELLTDAGVGTMITRTDGGGS